MSLKIVLIRNKNEKIFSSDFCEVPFTLFQKTQLRFFCLLC